MVNVRSLAVTGQVKSVTSRLEPEGTVTGEEKLTVTDLSASDRELSDTEGVELATSTV